VIAEALIETLRARGVALRPDGDRLRVRPAEALTPAELEALRQHKAAVLDALRAAPVPAEAPALGPHQTIPFTACSVCAELPYCEIDYVRIGGRLFVVPARRGTFAAYAGVPLCPRHARERAGRSA
jgi:hypothetical protein